MSYDDILGLPEGARFHRCALQVNPYEYLVRHHKQTKFTSEADYNAAIVEACQAKGIEVVGVTDHYRIRPAQALIEALQTAGITVFPGFEAVTKDGVHFLVLFGPATPVDTVQGYIHACGIHGDLPASPTGALDAIELIEQSRLWGAQLIAAHCTQSGGLFAELSGQPRINVFTNQLLTACAIPAARSDVPVDVRRILDDQDPAYSRDRKIAAINAADVCDPDDFNAPSSTTQIRMDTPTIEGLRQAFLDYESRIRLNTDPVPDGHPELLGMEIESEGFLKGLKVRFNEGLNVLIGGRGAGKSALIECIRYALNIAPLGAEAAKAHDAMIKNVACSGTKIVLHVLVHKPAKRRYRIERVVAGSAKIFDEAGDEVPLAVQELLGPISIYGQSELAELARDQRKLTALLQRFVKNDDALDDEFSQVTARLADSRERLISTAGEIDSLRERQLPLAGVLATLAKYKDLGVEERLSEQAAVVKSEGLVASARERLTPIRELARSLEREAAIEKREFDENNRAGIAAAESIDVLHATLTEVETEVRAAAAKLIAALTTADAEISSAASGVAAEKAAVSARFEAALRELQKEKIDGAEFIRLREQVERLQPIGTQIDRLEQQAADVRSERASDLDHWRELRDKKLENLEATAKRVSKTLEERLRVTIARGQDRRNLIALIREVGGRLHEAQVALESAPDIDVGQLAAACRAGTETVEAEFGFTGLQAGRLCAAGEPFFMALEQTELLPTTKIEFNIAPAKGPAQWKTLGDLSIGQKATALLHLLMLDSDSPLILDQPEDNLDNRYVSKSVVPKVREEKRRRQLVFSTHNANIPVLGDAEQIIAIDADGEAAGGSIRLDADHMGSIDSPIIATEVKEILEGGKAAFEDRRTRYGF